MPETYYVFECGCRYGSLDIKRFGTSSVICPTHNRKLLHKEIDCLDCGGIVKFKRGFIKRCNSCSKIYQNEMNKKRQMDIRNKRIKSSIACIDCGVKVEIGRNAQKTKRCESCRGEQLKLLNRTMGYRENRKYASIYKSIVGERGIDPAYTYCTLEEVGKFFNISRERARQIEAKALKKFKNRAMKNPVLRVYIEEIMA